MEVKEKRKGGGKRCIAGGCSNTNAEGVSMCLFPKDKVYHGDYRLSSVSVFRVVEVFC